MELHLNAPSPVTGNAPAVAAQAPTDAQRDMFTRLLVAQVRNQDPLSPQDPSQYVQQLSQLAQTEALHTLASQSNSTANALQSLQALALGAQVGRRVTVETETLELAQSTVYGEVTLPATGRATLVLTGENGIAHPVPLGTLNRGTVPFAIDPGALGLPPGRYHIAVQNEQGQRVPVGISGRLEQVRLAADGSLQAQVSHVGNIAAPALRAIHDLSSPSL